VKINQLFREKTLFSLEVFPPKDTVPVEELYSTLGDLRDLQPDFISVTCGASGTAINNATVEVAALISHRYGIEGVAHLPGINLSKEEVLTALGRMRSEGIDNILALRGDRNPQAAPKQDFAHANELVAFIAEQGDFNIIGACYPEGHPEATSLAADIANLKRKVDTGVSHLISQLFFDNDDFLRFVDAIRRTGIEVPVEAGIMPVTSKGQILKMTTLCGAHIPPALDALLQRYDDPAALRAAGIDYAINQINGLLEAGVDGIHLYTMNNAQLAHAIYGSTFAA